MKHKIGINQSFTIDAKTKEKFAKLGKNYHSIDFEISQNLSEYNVDDKSNPIGTLFVGNTKIELTHSECNKIIATLEDATIIAKQKKRLGIF